MTRALLAGLLGLVATAFAAPDQLAPRIQWSLRFTELRPHSAALTGCYGTASYQYVLGSIDDLVAHREGLRVRANGAKLKGTVWSATADAKHVNNVLGLDLETGRVVSSAKIGFPSPKAIVFCKCRKDDLLRCNPSGLPALGSPFFTYPDKADPKKVAVWFDARTGLEWHYRWHPACWNSAKPACEEDGKRLPTLDELFRAQPELKQTAVAERVRRTGKPVWALNEEKENAWAFSIDRGEKELHPKKDCLTAICVQKTGNGKALQETDRDRSGGQ